jgi:hypothetical protein
MNITKTSRIIFLILLPLKIFSQDVSVWLEPKVPIAGEVFKIFFKVKWSGEHTPKIIFSPQRLKLLSHKKSSVSLESSMKKGTLQMEKSITYSYTLLSESPGVYPLPSIWLSLADKKEKLSPMEIEVLKKSSKPAAIFSAVISSKHSVYVNEGFEVRFYLYYKNFLRARGEIVEFPQFPHFINRFHRIKKSDEVIYLQGVKYYRRLYYSSRLYPQKTGIIKLKPLKLKVKYFPSLMSKNWVETTPSGQSVSIEVKKWPEKNKPPNFMGPVGDHHIKFVVSGQTLLVNEVFRVRIMVEGPGALEKFDMRAPYKDERLDLFDTKSDFKKIGLKNGRKIFEYSYLAKSPGKIGPLDFKFFFLSVKKNDYVSKIIKFPGIEIKAETSRISKNKDQIVGDQKGYLAPDFFPKRFTAKWFWLLWGLFLIVLLQLVEILIKAFKKNKRELKLLKLHEKVRQDISNYQALGALILGLSSGQNASGVSLSFVLEKSKLSIEAKNYFSRLLLGIEDATYGEQKKHDPINYEKKYFKELMKLVLRR